MQFATLHISKAKSSSGGLHAHIDRDHVPKNSNPNRVKENFYVVDNKLMTSANYKAARKSGQIGTIQERIDKRIDEGYTAGRKIRANTVKELDLMLTGSHDTLSKMNTKQLRNWYRDNYIWTCDRFGMENVVGFALHLDEATPHIHATVVPLTPDGRLSAKELLNGTDRNAPRGEHLRLMQDSYAEAMAKHGLKRGISAQETQVKHTTTKNYYRELNAAAQQLEPLKRTSLNFNKAKEEAIAKLADASSALNQAKEARKENINRAIADVRASTHLVGLASQFGYQVDRLKSCQTSIQMRNKDGEQLVLKRSEKGNWMYFKRGTNEKGNVVDFLRAQGETWQQITARSTIAAMAKTHNEANPMIEHIAEEIQDLQEAHLQAKERWNSKPNKGDLSHYLAADRGLGHFSYKSLLGATKGGPKSVSFKTMLPTEKGSWIHCGEMTYTRGADGKSRKSLPKGLPKGWAVIAVGDDPNKPIIMAESPIDGLSYAKLQGLKSFTVMASCGRPSKKQLEALNHLPDERRKILAVDSDAPGQEMANLFSQHLANTKVAKPDQSFKDWNEQLLAYQKTQQNSHSQTRGIGR